MIMMVVAKEILFLTYIMVQENSSRSKNQKIMSEQVS
jgi:hypothetical protein